VKVSGKTGFSPVPVGLHNAVCIGVIDLGTQHGSYKGKPKVQRKVLLRWEFPDLLIEDGEYAGKPRVLSQSYTALISDKATLRKLIESWRGQPFTPAELDGFELKKLLGRPCQIMIQHNVKDGTTYSNIASIIPYDKKKPPLKPVAPLLYFSFDEYDHGKFLSLSEGLRAFIEKSDEWKQLNSKGGEKSSDDDDWEEGFDSGSPDNADDPDF
jgi:hypothetical protein